MAGNTADTMAEIVPNKPVDANANPKPAIVSPSTPADDNTPSNPVIISMDNEHDDDANNPDSHPPYDDDAPQPKYILHGAGNDDYYDDYCDDYYDSFDTEPLSDYIPGGFHPVALGDVLAERFRVVHKLGYGGYSTVWLCHDQSAGKWRAVKIISARQSNEDCPELRALALFGGVGGEEVLAAGRVQLPIESFWIEGPNGRHLCFVLPLMGATLKGFFHFYGHLEGLVRDVCFQLVEAMRFIHAHGICHGDFRPGNVLFRLVPGVDEWEEDAIMKLLGKPELIRVERTDGTEGELEPGVPAYLVDVGRIDCGSGVCAPEIAVIDFGVSYHISNPPVGKSTGIPHDCAAPEDFFEQYDLVGFATDLWALGVSLCQVRRGFTPFAEAVCYGPQDAVEKMETTISPLPDPYRTIWHDWGFDFVNSTGEGGGPPADDSWKDTTMPVSHNIRGHRYNEQSRIDEGLPPNYLHWRLCSPGQTSLGKLEGADMEAQLAADATRLPTYDRAGSASPAYEDTLRYTMPRAEADQFFDLLSRIFRWLPADRATIDQIAGHAWFEERDANARERASCSPARAAAAGSSGVLKRARSASPAPSGKKRRSGKAEDTAGMRGGTEVVDANGNPGDDKTTTTSETWAGFWQRITMGNLRRGGRAVVRRLVWFFRVLRTGLAGALGGLRQGGA